MTVYRGMDIGTAKPTTKEQREVRYHLLDLVDASETYSVAEFQRTAREALADIASRGKIALLVGGTGLYGRAIIDNFTMPGEFPELRASLTSRAETELDVMFCELTELDPSAAEKIEPTNARRVVRALEVIHGSGELFSSFGPGLQSYFEAEIPQVGLQPPLEVVDAAIDQRYRSWIEQGLVDEVRTLRDNPHGLSRTAAQAVGYKELAPFLDGESDLESCILAATLATRQLVRRQRAWFRRDPRIEWFEKSDDVLSRLLTVVG
jgi:tRNA dimethylallyltransferase